MEDDVNVDNLEGDVKDLVDQLKEDQKLVKKTIAADDFELKREELEEFILNKTGSLINTSVDMVNTVKHYVQAAPNSEEVEALASLMKSATSSIDSLSKILVQDMRSDTTIKAKTMDIESKKQLLNQDYQNKALLSREDVLEGLLNKTNVIEAQVVDIPDSED
ncbi:hypothetical protein N9033_00620 [bacterium]|jgi:hypothetical protein|nr:hypothetical protein [bacterium]